MNKKNLILGAILILLVASAYLYQGPLKKWQENNNKPVNFLSKLAVDKIDKIQIDNKGEQVLLKKGDKWFLEGPTEQVASSTKISNFLDQLKQAATAEVELVSTNVARKSDFQTDDSGVKLVLSANNTELVSFTAGKFTDDFLSSYLSQKGSNDTYVFKGVNMYVVLSDKNWTGQVKK